MTCREERRKFLRRDCLMLCRCEGESFRFHGYLVNLSFGGAGTAGTEQLPPLGAELLVTIGHVWKNLQMRSRVVWLKPGGENRGYAQFGIKFLDSLQMRQDKLAEFLPKSVTVDG